VPCLIDRLGEGDLQFTPQLRKIETLLARLDRVGNRLAVSALLSAFIVSLAC